MRCACWITKATNTQPEYVILIGFLRQQWLRERYSMSRALVTLPALSHAGVRRTVLHINWMEDILGSMLLRNADIYQITRRHISVNRYLNHAQTLLLHCAVQGLYFCFCPHNYTQAGLRHCALL